MKKTYIIPTQYVHKLQPMAMLAESIPYDTDTTPADDGYSSDNGGGGNTDVKEYSAWENEW